MYLSWHTKLSLWTPQLSSPLAQFPIRFPFFVAQELWKPVLVLLRVAGVDSALAGRKVGGYNVMLVGRRAVDIPSIYWKSDTEDLQWYVGCWKRTTPDYTSSPPDCTLGTTNLIHIWSSWANTVVQRCEFKALYQRLIPTDLVLWSGRRSQPGVPLAIETVMP